MRSKQEWRRVLKRRVAALGPARRRRASARIHAKLRRTQAYRRSSVILFYAAKSDEVSTLPAIRRALAAGKHVFLPRLAGRARGMGWGEVRRLRRDLIKGRFGISEPRRTCPTVPVSKLNLVVCPGMGFDRKGTRLGRGGGYYDRLLRKLKPKTAVIGLAFSCQKVSILPRSSHDVRIPKVITG